MNRRECLQSIAGGIVTVIGGSSLLSAKIPDDLGITIIEYHIEGKLPKPWFTFNKGDKVTLFNSMHKQDAPQYTDEGVLIDKELLIATVIQGHFNRYRQYPEIIYIIEDDIGIGVESGFKSDWTHAMPDIPNLKSINVSRM